jgi:hypothetical protein
MNFGIGISDFGFCDCRFEKSKTGKVNLRMTKSEIRNANSEIL